MESGPPCISLLPPTIQPMELNLYSMQSPLPHLTGSTDSDKLRMFSFSFFLVRVKTRTENT
jgi:hypothetical protein